MQFPRHFTRRQSRRNSGTILVLTAVITMLMAMVAASTLESVQIQVEMGRENAKKLEADLLAESALNYARKQLELNGAWEGMEEGGLSLGENMGFHVERLDDGSSPGSVHMLLTGQVGDAVVQREAMVNVSDGSAGDPELFVDKAIVLMGGVLERGRSPSMVARRMTRRKPG